MPENAKRFNPHPYQTRSENVEKKMTRWAWLRSFLYRGKKPSERDNIDGSEQPRPRICSDLLDDGKTTHENALALCDCLIHQYLRWKKRNHLKSNLAQYTALILTAITPVLLLIPVNSEHGEYVKLLAAAASAVAAIATGLLAISGWRENFIRYGYVWHALQTEKCRYLTRATKEYAVSDVNDKAQKKETAARYFARNIEQLVMAEVTDWRALMQDVESGNRSRIDQSPPGATSSDTQS
jgi:hypothetical protein